MRNFKLNSKIISYLSKIWMKIFSQNKDLI
jgi:hypothetical protein